MNIALFFGSFNPFHLGHQSLAEWIVNNYSFDELWFIVSPCNPLKEKADLIDENLRLKMLLGATKNNPKLKACDIEFNMPIPSYTIDTLRKLSSTFTQHTFSLLIGGDNALVFDKWKNYKELLDEYSVYVYPRTGSNYELVRHTYPSMKLIDSPIFDIASTQIRTAIKQQKDVSSLVHPFVNQFIIKNNLYKD